MLEPELEELELPPAPEELLELEELELDEEEELLELLELEELELEDPCTQYPLVWPSITQSPLAPQ